MKKQIQEKISNQPTHIRMARIGGIITIILTLALIARAIYMHNTKGVDAGYNISGIVLVFFTHIAPCITLHFFKKIDQNWMNWLSYTYPIFIGLSAVIGFIADFDSIVELGFIRSAAVPYATVYAIFLAALKFVKIIEVKDGEE